MKNLKRVAGVLLAFALLAGCGSEEPTEQTEDTSVTPPNDATQMDASSDTDDEENDEPDGDSKDVADSQDETEESDGSSDYIFASFTYRKVEEGAISTTSGVSVNLIGATEITKIESNSRTEELSDDDFEVLYNEYLDEEVFTKMKDGGWECGSQEKYNGARYEFEAKLGTQADAPEPIRVISGCIAEDSTQPDAELAQELITKLEDLRDEYFN